MYPIEKEEKGKRRNLLTFTIANTAFGFGDSCFEVVIAPLYLELTQSVFWTGTLMSIFSVVFFLSSPVAGRLSDKFGRKRMKLIAAPFYITGVMILILTTQSRLYLLIISILLRALGGSSESINYNMLLAESTDKSKNGKGLIFSFMAFLYFSGKIVGSVFITITDFEMREYLLIPLGVSIIYWFCQMIFLSETHVRTKEKPLKRQHSLWRGMFKNSKMNSAMILLTMDVLFWGLTGAVYQAGLRDYYNLSIDELAMLGFWFNISMMIFQIPAGKLTDKIGIRKCLLISMSFGLIIYPLNVLVFFMHGNFGITSVLFPGLILSQILWAGTASTFIPSEQIILTDLDDSRKAESFGIVSFVRGFGAMPNGIAGGYLMENVHFTAPFMVTTIGIVLEIWYLAKFGHNFEKNDELDEHNNIAVGQENIVDEIVI